MVTTDVFAAAVDHPVRVSRRDGEALVLTSESADQACAALLELAFQLVAVSTITDGSLASPVSDRFPWMLALSPLALSPLDREARANSSVGPHLFW